MPAEVMGSLLAEAILHSRASEKLLAVASHLKGASDALVATMELDPALGPELATAHEHLMAALESVQAGLLFVNTRVELAAERGTASLMEWMNGGGAG